MKTAVEKICEYIQEDEQNSHYAMERASIRNCIIVAKSLLESEKQQIIKAYDDAFNYVVGGGFVAKTGEQYFEEIYNDKK